MRGVEPGEMRDVQPGWMRGVEPGEMRDVQPGWMRDVEPNRMRMWGPVECANRGGSNVAKGTRHRSERAWRALLVVWASLPQQERRMRQASISPWT
eukprot:353562-Chlamydomonas_euryale.AAC.5